MTNKKKDEVIPDSELKDFSITIENMLVGTKVKLCLIVRNFNKEKKTYDVFQSEIPKKSTLGLEVAEILKQAKKILKDSAKKK